MMGAGRRAANIACDLAAFAVPAVAYIASVSHEPASWDTAELQGVPYILGIPHPTGFPLYVLLGYAWSHLLAFDTVAFRLNAFGSVCVAAAALAAYLVARELGALRIVALGASLWFAFVQTVWSHASRAETHDLALALSGFAILAFLHALRGGDRRWYVVACALLGLGLAAHPVAIWLIPGFVAGAIVARRRPTRRTLLAGIVAIVAGLSLYLYLPLRSSWIVAHRLDPTAVLAGTNGGIFWNYDDPSTWNGLLAEVSGSDFDASDAFVSALNPLRAQDALQSFIDLTLKQYGAFALVFALAGFVVLWRRDWRTALTLLGCCAGGLFFAAVYGAETDLDRYRLLALWMSVPLIASLAATRDGAARTLLAPCYGIVLLAGAAGAWLAGASFYEHAPGEGGRWAIAMVARHVPAGAVIVSDWLDATSLAYGAYVDGTLPGRIIVSGFEPAQLSIYRVWAREHPVFLLANPTQVPRLPNAPLAAKLDAYHNLLRVQP